MREGNCVQVSNPHLSTIDEDFLVRFKMLHFKCIKLDSSPDLKSLESGISKSTDRKSGYQTLVRPKKCYAGFGPILPKLQFFV